MHLFLVKLERDIRIAYNVIYHYVYKFGTKIISWLLDPSFFLNLTSFTHQLNSNWRAKKEEKTYRQKSPKSSIIEQPLTQTFSTHKYKKLNGIKYPLQNSKTAVKNQIIHITCYQKSWESFKIIQKKHSSNMSSIPQNHKHKNRTKLKVTRKIMQMKLR